MNDRLVLMLSCATLLGVGCGGEEPKLEESAAVPAEAAPIAGRYQVAGVTIALESGYKRDIAGTVILATEGDHYTATFDLTTTYPDPAAAEPILAEVIGKGEGSIEGRTLRGTAQTQIVAGTVPNIDPNFAFIPRSVSTRVVSTSVTTIAADGSVTIEIENAPAEGEHYAPTRTTLSGQRLAGEEVDEEVEVVD